MLAEIRFLSLGSSVHFGDASDSVTVFRNKSGFTVYFGSLKRYSCYAEVRKGKFSKSWGSYLPPASVLKKYDRLIGLMKELTMSKEREERIGGLCL